MRFVHRVAGLGTGPLGRRRDSRGNGSRSRSSGACPSVRQRVDVCPGPSVIVSTAPEYVPEPDPFESFSSLFDLNPLDIGGEVRASGLAREGESGDWTAAVPALPSSPTEVRCCSRSATVEVREVPRSSNADPRHPGARRDPAHRSSPGRVGLLEALEERLADRPDLMAARLLIDPIAASSVPVRRVRPHRCGAASSRCCSGLRQDERRRSVVGHGRGTMAPQHVDRPRAPQRSAGTRNDADAVQRVVRRGAASSRFPSRRGARAWPRRHARLHCRRGREPDRSGDGAV